MTTRCPPLFAVEIPAKVEVQLEDASVKGAPEPPAMTVLPRTPDDAECYVLVWRPGGEDDELRVWVVWDALDIVCRRLAFVN